MALTGQQEQDDFIQPDEMEVQLPVEEPAMSPSEPRPRIVVGVWLTLRCSTALDFDKKFLQAMRLHSFNPNSQGTSDLDLLFTLGRTFGPGITRSQFKQIMRCCTLCHNLCLRERRHAHRCHGRALVAQAEDFDMIDSLLTYDEHAGLRQSDLSRLLTRCAHCNRICLVDKIEFHECSNSSLY